jgi:hypothetical protein
VRVAAATFADANDPKARETGLVVSVREPGGQREALSYVDADEIDPLLAAVDTLAKLQPNLEAMQEVEGHYQTRGDLEVANTSVNGTRLAGVRCVQYLPLTSQLSWATSQLRLPRLAEFGQLLAAAKQTLDRAAGAGDGGGGGGPRDQGQ